MEKMVKGIYGAQLGNYTKMKVNLPMYLTEGREFWEVTFFGIKFILVNFRFLLAFRLDKSSSQIL